MKAKWLLQTKVFDENLDGFCTELTKQGFEWKTIEHSLSHDTELDQFEDEDCVVFYGALSLASKIRRTKRWTPGAYYDSKNFRCSTYYTYFGKHLFSETYAMMPFAEIKRLKDDSFFRHWIGTVFFIRPDSGFKEFTGQTVILDKPLFGIMTLDELQNTYRVEDDLLCVIASAKHIEREWRVVIGDKKVITGCQYKHRYELCESEDFPEKIKKYAEKIAQCDWEPARVYVMDIAEHLNGSQGLLEINSFSTSGLYKCDLSKIVTEVSKIAEDEWKEYQEV